MPAVDSSISPRATIATLGIFKDFLPAGSVQITTLGFSFVGNRNIEIETGGLMDLITGV